jgi:predicted Zn-dependent peptidase
VGHRCRDRPHNCQLRRGAPPIYPGAPPHLPSELNQGLFLGRTLAYWSDLNAKIAKLTVVDVNAAIKKFVDPTKLAEVRAGDLAKRK